MREETAEYRVDGEETYEGVDCWVLSYTITMEQEGTTIVFTWCMAKSDLRMVHGRIQTYVNDTLMFEQEFDPGQAPGGTEPPEPVDLNYVVGYETVTVHAGTFTNCMKVQLAEESRLSHIWVHPNVPIWGLVKVESYDSGELLMTMELLSYGG